MRANRMVKNNFEGSERLNRYILSFYSCIIIALFLITIVAFPKNLYAVANIVANKTQMGCPIPAGQESTIEYELFVSNNGSNNATNVVVTDQLPTNAVVLQFPAPECSLSVTNLLTCNLGTILPGLGFIIGVNIAVTPEEGEVISNQGLFTFVRGVCMNTNIGCDSDADCDFGEISCIPSQLNGPTNFTSCSVFGTGNLEVTKTSPRNPEGQCIVAGIENLVSYNIELDSTGAVTDVTLTDTLPAEAVFESVSPEGACSEDNGIVTCNFESIDSNESELVTIDVTITPAPNQPLITNTAQVSFFDGEQQLMASDSVNICVDDTVEIEVTKTSPTNPEGQCIVAGIESPVSYNIELDSTGTGAATDVTLTDTLPAGSVFESVSPEGACSEDNGIVTCTFASIASGEMQEVDIDILFTPDINQDFILNEADVIFFDGSEQFSSSASVEVCVMVIGDNCNEFFSGIFEGDTRFMRENPAFPEDANVTDFTTLSITDVTENSFNGVFNADWLQAVSITATCTDTTAEFAGEFGGTCGGNIEGELVLSPENEIQIINGRGMDCKGDYDFFTDNGAPLIREGTSGNVVLQGSGSANTQAGCALVDDNQSASSSSFLIYLLIPAFIFIRRRKNKLKEAGKLVKQIARFSSVLLFLALITIGISFIGNMTATAQTILKNCDDVVDRSLAESLDIACSELKSMEGSLNEQQLQFLDKCQQIINGNSNVCKELDPVITSTNEVVTTLLSIQSQKQFKNIRSRLANVRAGGGSTVSLNGKARKLQEREYSPMLASTSDFESISQLIFINQADQGTSYFSKLGVFLNSSFNFGDRDNSNPSGLSSNGYDFNIFEIIGGLDYRFTDYLILGLSLNYSYADADFTRSNGSVTSNSYYGTLYGSAFWDAFYVDALLSLGGANYDIKRAVSGSIQKGDTSGFLYRLALAAGYDIYLNSFSISPYGRISYSQNNIGSYSENTVSDGSDDAAFALKFNSQEAKSFSTALGTRVAYAWSTGWGVVRPEALFEWIHEFEDSPDTVIAAYEATDQVSISGKPAGIDGDYFNLGGGVSALFPQGFSVFVYYERTLWYENLNANYITGGIRKEF